MTDPIDDQEVEDEFPVEQPGFDNNALPRLVESIQFGDKRRKWEADVVLNLGSKKWKPAAVGAKRNALLHVVSAPDLPRHISERLRLARTLGLNVYVAVSIDHLYDEEFLQVLADLDARVYVIDDGLKERRLKPRHFMAAMADLQIPVGPESRKIIGRTVWDKLSDGTKHERGQRLEAIVAYLFDQVHDLRVVERNLRNASQEIDLVLQIDNYGTRCWHQPGVPFILVEAKNTRERATQPMVSILITKLRTKRQRANIGFLVSPAGFTEDARIEELRYSESSNCVVMLDGDSLEDLISADDLDETLEKYVRRALLR